MTAPVSRLKRRRDFVAVTKARQSAAQPGLVLQIRCGDRRDETTVPRIGFTASKKVGNAVFRNRAKRRLRALAAEIIAPRAIDGCDYVLIARAATVDRPYAALQSDLKKAMKRLRVWTGEDAAV